jgi:beta-aspartyl-peptidase (threonine type)
MIFRCFLVTLLALGLESVGLSQEPGETATLDQKAEGNANKPVPAGAADEKTVAQIHSLLKAQQAAWNRASIADFMTVYWHDPQLSFCSGGDLERGWQQTFDRYTRRYPDAETMGQLSFDELETQLLSAELATTFGRWSLRREEPVGGRFTLIWRRFDDGWKIIHDHTSSNAG